MAHAGDPTAACTRVLALDALLAEDRLDDAIEAGLMELDLEASVDARCQDALLRVAAMQRQLAAQWAARARYEARTARLQRRAAERQARRTPPPAPASKPALPPAVAAALARAKARAAGPSRT
ncbi:hypothetical protein [Pseudoxanthomonas sp. JBR18]|uniref:hypothetical protein n=1 Tax=Pseudoxanthomonas sp. JBR18 TaxID=2969308 RepID=UPI0023061D90|nr:hypothetical protein [Pseudoxanthomonas sp. JBR18]WCE04229.1 hypothetical protein PJ250_19515 [Pseudoxanthomonas sp. JBR18]